MNVLRIGWDAAKGFQGKLVFLGILGFIVAMLESATLIALLSFVGKLTSHKSSAMLAKFALFASYDALSVQWQAIIILAISTIRFILALFLEWEMSHLWVAARARMQQEMFALHLGAKLDFLNASKAGTHLSHIIDGPAFAAVFYLHFARYVSTIIMFVFLGLTLFFVSPVLVLIAVVVGLAYGGLIRRVSTKVSYQSGQEQAAAVRHQAQFVTEGLAGIRYLRTLSVTQGWLKDFVSEARSAEAAMGRAGYWNTVPSRALEFLVLAAFMLVVMYGIHTGGDILAFLPKMAVYFLAIVRVLPTLSILGNGRMQMMQSLPHLQKLLELRQAVPQESDEGQKALPPALADVDIRFDHLTFAYQDRDVLTDASFEILPRSITMIAGASGQGKSTIFDLLLRFVEPKQGAITVAGTDIKSFDLHAWRGKFAYIGQDPFLFHDTVLENLRLANPTASDETIAKAAKAACVDEFIDLLADGWNTVLADRGQSLSGGQRQRIAIARALLSPADILLLDEPTSALDAETEKKVIHNLLEFRGDRTVVLITHRPELLAYADQVLMVNEGKVTR
ncbi:MAG TPA: ABC transporter ATP-binding protein [Methylophilaceae bacterium]|jgi:ABC-type multidrug transport system fused ATPase/permease subunit